MLLLGFFLPASILKTCCETRSVIFHPSSVSSMNQLLGQNQLLDQNQLYRKLSPMRKSFNTSADALSRNPGIQEFKDKEKSLGR